MTHHLLIRSGAVRRIVVSWLLCVVSVVACRAAEEAGALKDYVQRADESFRWSKRREGKLAGGDYAELALTSQTWRGIPWRHQLFVFKPAQVEGGSQAILLIGGGRWREELAGAPGEGENLPREAQLIAAAATALKCPVAVLLQVPHQPILGGLVEDEAISYTIDQYLKTKDPDWPLLLPMVKSVVRAMDAIQQQGKQEWSLDVKHFTLTGASKRGWTTWLTSAVDSRVTALMPMVIDVLNMTPQMKHQLETWGKFSEQIQDYTQRGIQDRAGTAAGDQLNQIVDPYSYRAAIVQPKLIMLGTNDRYWPLDALNLYWDGLSGEKYICYVPNNGHGLKDLARIVGGLTALHARASGTLELPKLTWKLSPNGKKLELSVTSNIKPASVSAWIASAKTKDFRDATWTSQPAAERGGAYQYELEYPASGYAAMFGEAMFQGASMPYYLSTNVRIVGAASAE
jgi:PhoPQ-activated pathogenicity-related protein